MADVSELIGNLRELDPAELTQSMAVLAVYVSLHPDQEAQPDNGNENILSARGYVGRIKSDPTTETTYIRIGQLHDPRRADAVLHRDGYVGERKDDRGRLIANYRSAFYPICDQVSAFFIHEGGIPNLEALLDETEPPRPLQLVGQEAA